MPKRSPQRSQQHSKHDAKVKQLAQELEKQDWAVQAAISGYEQPDAIGKGGYIPDIQAIKKGAERLIEVETKETVESDKKQHTAFRRRAAQKRRTTFRIEVV